MKKWLNTFIERTPVVLPIAIAAFGSVAIIFLLIGQFRSAYIWPLGLIAAMAVSVPVIRYYPSIPVSRERKFCNALVLLGVIVWFGFNLFYTSQHLFTNRDPATYANAGAWLIHHNSLKMNIQTPFENVAGVTIPRLGFAPLNTAHNIYGAQGQHLLPAFLGLFGRLVGVAKMLHLNVLFGATALLAIYAFTRQLARPYWAMVTTGALAGAMPFLYFSRDTYTEPLLATFTFGGLALLWIALKSNRLSLWFLAGLSLGAGTLARIDGYLTLVGVAAFLVIHLAIAPRAERRRAILQSASIITGMAATAILGWLDVSRLSTFYYISTRAQFRDEILALLLVIVVGIFIVGAAWKSRMIKLIDNSTEAWRSAAVSLMILSLTTLLISRPLWYRPSSINPATHELQRSFTELSAKWVSWYIGPLLAALGVVGITLAAGYALKRKSLQSLFFVAALAVIVGISLVYITNPSISPDQIWASRRIMPIILPGIAAFGAVALDWLTAEYNNRLRWIPLYMGMVGVLLIVGPLITSRPDILDRDTAELAPINAVCTRTPHNAAILWLGVSGSQAVMPTITICGIPSEAFKSTSSTLTTQNTLAQVSFTARSKGFTPIVGVMGSESGLLPFQQQKNMVKISTFSYQQLQQTFTTPPQARETVNDSILMGTIQPDGSIQPI